MSKIKKESTVFERDDYTHGNKNSLLGLYGFVDADKAIDAIRYRTGVESVDIGKINETATKGCVWINDRGEVLDTVDNEIESNVRYKVYPIGYTDNKSSRALCASFVIGFCGFEGVYICTFHELIRRTVDFYAKGAYRDMSTSEIKYIKSFDKEYDIIGFGKIEVDSYNNNLINSENNIDIKATESEHKRDIEHIELSDIVSYESVKEEEYVEENIKTESTVTEFENESELSQSDDETYDVKVTDAIKTLDKDNIAGMTVKQLDNYLYNKRMDLYNDIYNRLLIKENWKVDEKNRLSLYIKNLLDTVANFQNRCWCEVGNGYILSKDKSVCLINTGLMDKYSNDIFIVDLSNNETSFNKKNLEIVTSKSYLVVLGFNPDSVKYMPKPIKFYKTRDQLVFSCDSDDFEIEDYSRLEHIIYERRYRFPEKYKHVSCERLCDMIKSEVLRSIKISERDYTYVSPMYNIKSDRIQYLMPLHLDTGIDEPSELTLVVGERNGFWCVFTVINTDDAYDNARLINKPCNSWLKTKCNIKAK